MVIIRKNEELKQLKSRIADLCIDKQADLSQATIQGTERFEKQYQLARDALKTAEKHLPRK